ncbi:MFS transporter [Streptomyces alboniger]|uniref:MFS transporter n=1 Tax=Streptomyces alboniger TaxID=132473 RepID=A0A5J6H885_STRAD|nr:MFS transporter [Streptomyces alboniger]QEV16286.1 MFS transporter [Streptomyces alboniger]
MRPWGVLGVLSLALMLLGVDQTVLNVALPEMQDDLGLGAAQLQWVVGAHTLALAAGVLAAGNWGDRRGRRGALIAGLVVCGAASVLGAVAEGPAGVIAARALMGAGAAFMMPATLSILVHVFTDAARQRLAVTIWATVAGVGVLVGPVLGGWLLEHYSWRACFWGNVPLVLLTLLCVPLVVPPCREEEAPAPDPVGLILSSAGLSAVVWSFIQAPARGWTDGVVLAVAAVGLVLLAVMLCWERRAPAPMLPLGLFRHRGYAVAAASLSLLFFALVGSTFLLTFYLQGVRGMTPLGAGRTMLIGGLGVAVGGLISAVATRRAEARWVMVAGLSSCAGAFLLLAGTTTDSGAGRIHVFLVLVGVGAGLTGGPATGLIMRAVPQGRAGVGAGVNDAVRSLGSTAGVAVLGSVFNTVYSGRMAGASGGGSGQGSGGGARDHLLSALAEAKLMAASAPVGSTGGGQSRAHRMELARRLVDDAAQAFLAGLRTTAWVSACVCAVGVCLVLLALPREGRRAKAADAVAAPVLTARPGEAG